MMATSDGRPSFATLIDWLDGRLPADEDRRVAGAVATGGPALVETVEWLRGVLATARTVPMYDPPPVIRQNLRQHFARWSQARAVLSGTPRRITATLLFDSRKDLALAGVRGADTDDDAVHLAFTCEAGDVLVDGARTRSGRFRLDGQVLFAQPGAAPVVEAEASAPGFRARNVDGDELGRFAIPDVPGEFVRLRLTNGEVAIEADLDLR